MDVSFVPMGNDFWYFGGLTLTIYLTSYPVSPPLLSDPNSMGGQNRMEEFVGHLLSKVKQTQAGD